MIGWLGGKSIHPEVVQRGREAGSWYTYLPARAPGFCLRTRHAFIWEDASLDLGHWRGLHPRAPPRVLMEARGHTFILHRRYVWDGRTVGCTRLRDLLPTLRHDALYHGLKEGAPLSRRQIDRAFRRDERAARVRGTWFHYWCIRLFGGLFNRREGEATMLVQPVHPSEERAPLEPDRPDVP